MASAPQKKIGSRTFSFGMLPATDAIRVEVALAKAIGEPLLRAFVKAQELQKTENLKTLADIKSSPKALDTIAQAMGMISSKMDAGELIKTMETVFSTVACDGNTINIDGTFTGRNRELWQVFMEGLRVNFADFFPDGLSLSPPVDQPST